MSLVEFKNVSKSFQQKSVLQNIDLSLKEGDVSVIIGPSGSGKSTLLRLINRLEEASSGSIFFQNKNILDYPVNLLRSEIGMVFQNFHLYPHLTVIENITLAPIRVKKIPVGEAMDLAMQLLEQVGLANRAKDKPASLSGGQQQRVAIARGLAMKPKLMLFDEPTSALDPETIRDVLDVVRKLVDEGMSMAIVTHEMGFAREVADKIIFIDEGRILSCLPPDQFFGKKTDERIKQFLSRVLQH